MSEIKPPLGPPPRSIWIERRIMDLGCAIARAVQWLEEHPQPHYGAGWVPGSEWHQWNEVRDRMAQYAAEIAELKGWRV